MLENLKQIMKCSRVKPEQIKYTKVKSKDERDILLKDHKTKLMKELKENRIK